MKRNRNHWQDGPCVNTREMKVFLEYIVVVVIVVVMEEEEGDNT